MSVVGSLERRRYRIAAVVIAVVALGVAVWLEVPVGDILTIGFAERSIRAATPIALAAIGGLYAEKSGVFNIGLEGFMIFGAVNAVAIAFLAAGGESATQTHLWLGVVGAVLVSVLYTIVFALLLIRYKADQIVAGLAVWFLGLGFGPFTALILWGSQSSPRVGRIQLINVPGLADLPVVGRLVFRASPVVLLTFVVAGLAWWVLYRTRYGYWIQAAGENPSALDTAGVSVNRVRYATTIFSGAMAGLAGAVLAVGVTTGFTGTGLTMVDGRGWIGIVAYLFGNYNPIGALGAALLFGAADMFQVQLQTVGIDVSANLMGILPYLIVIVVLTLYGKTRMPSYVGEPYESES
jgi:simple sugar transport system permease protein